MKQKDLPMDLYLLFFILFVHILIVLSNLTRPYFVIFGIFNQGLGTSISLLYFEILIIIVIALLYLRRIRWARQIGLVFYIVLMINTLISIIPFFFFRIELGTYLSQVIAEENVFHI